MPSIHDDKILELEVRANDIRKSIIEMLVAAGSGHSGGPLGMADIFAALYFCVMRHDPKNPAWEDRDRLILSNGHICPVRYAAMAHAGYFPMQELETLRKFGSRLQGHPERERLPGTETTSGPLGSGLAQGCGLAYAAKMDRKKWHVWVATSDAEHAAGVHWEAVMFAGKFRLNNVTCIVDRNNIQIDGDTEDIMPLEPLRDKYNAFNWHVLEIDGNNIREFVEAAAQAKSIVEKPTVIIAHTVPGKGVDFMEGDYRWHGKPPNKDEARAALAQLQQIGEKIGAAHG